MADITPDVEEVKVILAEDRFLRSLAGGLLGPGPDAEDAVQHAWLSHIENPPREPGALRAFLGRIVKNRALNLVRAKTRRSRHEKAAANPEALPSAEEMDQSSRYPITLGIGMNLTSSGTLGSSLWRGFLIVAAVAIGSSCPAQISRDEFDDLVRKLSEPATRQGARDALVALGEPVALELVVALSQWDPDRSQSIELLGVLGELGPSAARAMPSLVALFPDVPLELWPPALEAVGRIAPHAGGRRVTNRLLEMLMDVKGERPDEEFHDIILAWMKADQKMRYLDRGRTPSLINRIERHWGPQLGSIMEELGRRGFRASSALGPLKDYLQRGMIQMTEVIWEVNGIRVRFPFRDEGMKTAAEAMVKIDPEHPDSLVAHAVLLKHADPLVRHRSLSAIARSGPEAAEAVPFLKANLFDASPEGIADSCSALGMIGPDARGATIALEQLAEHEDTQIAGRAEAALRQIRR